MEDINVHVMNLANSIIGVSILAMPYCFHQCGIILSIVMLLISSIISRLACHFLVKSAIIARRKTFEYLAFHIFGSLGKLAIEIGIIGFLLGTCIAFFVVMGDLGPAIISEITGATTSNTMRTSILMALALFGILPLGLLRNVDSLSGVSQATIGFYCCLVLKVIFEAVPHILSGDWHQNINLWKPEGILQCLPIFSMSLFCQTQLFEIYQAVPNATLEKMNNLVRVAVNICTSVYIFVGVFGYIAFSKKIFTGNILLNFEPSFITYIMKIGFIISVAFSFPLVVFPCRASMYSLLYKEGYSIHEGVSNYIPEGKFKALTMFIVFTSLIVGIMIPNIELVLGLVGSTIGVMICVLFPVTCFVCISPKNTNERILAQFMLMIGIFVMVLGTYENLHKADEFEPSIVTINTKIMQKHNVNIVNTEIIPTKIPSHQEVPVKKTEIELPKMTEIIGIKEIRHEPPQPMEPIEENAKQKNKIDTNPNPAQHVNEIKLTTMTNMYIKVNVNNNSSKIEEVDIEAIKKEEKEVEIQEKEKVKEDNSNKILIDTIRKQGEVQQEIVEQQKKLFEVIKSQQIQGDPNREDKVNEEKVKAVKEIQEIALKAIEKISGKEDEKAKEPQNDSSGKKVIIIKNTEEPTKAPKRDFLQNLKQLESKKGDEELRGSNNMPLNKISGSQGTNRVNDASLNKSKIGEIRLDSNSKTNNKNPNNTAPLFLKLGAADNKINEDKIPAKLIPLPIAISNNIPNNNAGTILPHSDLIKKSDDSEVQVMRRDILQYVTN